MTVYESVLTPGNFTLKGKWPHIYITSFYRKLPPDVFGGTSVYTPAPRRVRLEFGTLRTDTFVPTDKNGRPRTFFQDRMFVREFFARTGAKPGDVVLFEEVTLSFPSVPEDGGGQGNHGMRPVRRRGCRVS